MFEAGAASARSAPQRPWVWPSIAATLAVALVSESLVVAVRPGPRVIERVVVVREPAPAGLDIALPRNAAALAPSPADCPERHALGRNSIRWLHRGRRRRSISESRSLCSGSDWTRVPERTSPLLSRSDVAVDPIDIPVPSAGHLRRLELEKLVNLNPGGPS